MAAHVQDRRSRDLSAACRNRARDSVGHGQRRAIPRSEMMQRSSFRQMTPIVSASNPMSFAASRVTARGHKLTDTGLTGSDKSGHFVRAGGWAGGRAALPHPRRRLSVSTGGVVASSCSRGASTTTKSATSHVNGGSFRRSLDRSSTGAGSSDALRLVVRRSQPTTTGKSAVLRVRASNRRKAPRRTRMPTDFFCAMQKGLSVDRALDAVVATSGRLTQPTSATGVCNLVHC